MDPYGISSKHLKDDSPPSNRLFIVAKTLHRDDLNSAFQYLRGLEFLEAKVNSQGTPKGYAYAIFSSIEDATVAMYAINAMQIKGVPLKAVYAEQTEKEKRQGVLLSRAPRIATGVSQFARGSSSAGKPKMVVDDSPPCERLFIVARGLHREDLDAVMGHLPGLVELDCKVRSSGEPKGYAYATFTTVDEATYAMQELNGLQVKNTVLKVVYAQDFQTTKAREAALGARHRTPYDEPLSKHRRLLPEPSFGMYGGLPPLSASKPKMVVDDSPPCERLFIVARGLHREDLDAVMGHLPGLVELDCKVRSSGEPKGYAYATFTTVDEATYAMQELNGLQVKNTVLKVVYAQDLQTTKAKEAALGGARHVLVGYPLLPPKQKIIMDDSPPSERLFIVGRSLYKEDLEAVMGHLPGFLDLEVKLTSSGTTKGYSYATFATVADATYAMQELNGLQVKDTVLKVVYAERKANETPGGARARAMYPPVISAPAGKPKLMLDDTPPSERLFIVGRSLYQEDLEAVMAHLPGFLEVDVKLKPSGITKGYSYATFATVDDATYAMQELNGLQVKDTVLKVVYAADFETTDQLSKRPPRRTSAAPVIRQSPLTPLVTSINDDVPRRPPLGVDPNFPPRSLLAYVLGSGCSISEDNLISLFRRYPGLVYVQPGATPNSGFVKYESAASASSALQGLNMKQIGAGTMKVYMTKATVGQKRYRE